MKSIACLLFTCLIIHTEAGLDRIIGGTDAEEGSFPWMAMLWDMGWWGGQFCGGSLIADGKWVLTARHCIRYNSPGDFIVKLGAHNKSDTSPNEQHMSVRSLYNHPDIDVGLIQLTQRAEFTEFVAPVELSNERLRVGNPMTVSGWGMTVHQDYYNHDLLQQVMVPIVQNTQCDPQFENFPYPYNFTKEWEICGGYEGETYTNVCHGDSGGPGVYRRNSRQAYKQYGIVSWGTPWCPEEADYAVFVDVSAIYDWVTETIEQATPPPECIAADPNVSFKKFEI